MSGDSKSQSHVHAAGITLGGGIQELFDLGKLDDLVELALDLSAGHAQDSPVEVDVLTPGELGVEAGADLQQAAHTPAHDGASLGRFGDAGEDLEQGALASPVAADDAEDFAVFYFEGYVFEGPDEFLVDGGRRTGDRVLVVGFTVSLKRRKGAEAASTMDSRKLP
jgi:hypothetical protein